MYIDCHLQLKENLDYFRYRDNCLKHRPTVAGCSINSELVTIGAITSIRSFAVDAQLTASAFSVIIHVAVHVLVIVTLVNVFRYTK